MENCTGVLICNNSSVFGKLLADRLERYDIHLNRICCDKKLVTEQLAKEKTDVAVFMLSSERREEAAIIREIKKQSDKVRVIALSYDSSRAADKAILEAGADLYMLMPVSVKEIAEAVLMMMNPDSERSCENQIAAFLAENSFPENLKGFPYLCMAVRICLENPESLDNISEQIYVPVAESFNTTPQIIERSIRFFSSVICSNKDSNSFIYNYYSGDEYLTNKELISIASDAFASCNCLFESEPKNDSELLKNL